MQKEQNQDCDTEEHHDGEAILTAGSRHMVTMATTQQINERLKDNLFVEYLMAIDECKHIINKCTILTTNKSGVQKFFSLQGGGQIRYKF